MMLIGLRCLISFPSNTFTRFMHMVGYTNTNPILFSDVVVLSPLTYSLQLLPVTVSPAGKGANRAHCCLSEIQITLHRKLRLLQVGTQGPGSENYTDRSMLTAAGSRFVDQKTPERVNKNPSWH